MKNFRSLLEAPSALKTIKMDSLESCSSQDYRYGLIMTFDPWENKDLSEEPTEILSSSLTWSSSESEEELIVCLKRSCRKKHPASDGSVCCSEKCFELWCKANARAEKAARIAHWEYMNTRKWTSARGWHYPGRKRGPNFIPSDI